jgi:hypothetical protein
MAPVTARAAIIDDDLIVLGWYVYGVLNSPRTDFPKG